MAQMKLSPKEAKLLIREGVNKDNVPDGLRVAFLAALIDYGLEGFLEVTTARLAPTVDAEAGEAAEEATAEAGDGEAPDTDEAIPTVVVTEFAPPSALDLEEPEQEAPGLTPGGVETAEPEAQVAQQPEAAEVEAVADEADLTSDGAVPPVAPPPSPSGLSTPGRDPSSQAPGPLAWPPSPVQGYEGVRFHREEAGSWSAANLGGLAPLLCGWLNANQGRDLLGLDFARALTTACRAWAAQRPRTFTLSFEGEEDDWAVVKPPFLGDKLTPPFGIPAFRSPLKTIPRTRKSWWDLIVPKETPAQCLDAGEEPKPTQAEDEEWERAELEDPLKRPAPRRVVVHDWCEVLDPPLPIRAVSSTSADYVFIEGSICLPDGVQGTPGRLDLPFFQEDLPGRYSGGLVGPGWGVMGGNGGLHWGNS